MKLEIQTTRVLKNISGASGIVKRRGDFYAVGDDSPYLLCLDPNFEMRSRIPIFSADEMEANRISKEHKPDFEAIDTVEDREIFIFGSGSRSPERDFFLRIQFFEEPEVATHHITDFYEHLRSRPEFQNSELNIEAAAYHRGHIILLNRKKNLIIRFPYGAFLDYLEGASFPGVEITEVSLPDISGVQAGFSGAVVLEQKELLIFSASVEDTGNAYDDGEILGSFIGLFDLETGRLVGELEKVTTPGKEHGPVKVESVAIEEISSENEIQLVLATDSDGGTSLIMRATLFL